MQDRNGMGDADISVTTRRSMRTAFFVLAANDSSIAGACNEPERLQKDAPVRVSEAGQHLMEHQH